MLGQHNLTDRLEYNELFNLFPAHIRSQLFNESETRTYKAGEIIFRRGEDGPWMAAILAGRVRLEVPSTDGKEMLLSMVERSEIFGERALLDGLPRAADAIAETDTTILIVKRDEFLPILFQYPEAMFGIIKVLCNRMLRYTNTLEMYALENMPSRLSQYLLFLSHKYGKEVNGKTVICAGLSQADIGRQLGSRRESVNKQLKAFIESGLISLQGDEITLLDPAGLEKICTPQER